MSLLDDITDFLFGKDEQQQDAATAEAKTTAQEATTAQTEVTAQSTQESTQAVGTQQTEAQQATDVIQRTTDTTKLLDEASVEKLRGILATADPEALTRLTNVSDLAVGAAADVDANTQRILDAVRLQGLNVLETEVLPQIGVLGQATGGSAESNTLVNQLRTQAINDLLAKQGGVEAEVLARGEASKLSAIGLAGEAATAGVAGIADITEQLRGAESETLRDAVSTEDTRTLQTQLSDLVKNTSAEEVGYSDLDKLINVITDESATGTTAGTTVNQPSILDWLNALGNLGPN